MSQRQCGLERFSFLPERPWLLAASSRRYAIHRGLDRTQDLVRLQ